MKASLVAVTTILGLTIPWSDATSQSKSKQAGAAYTIQVDEIQLDQIRSRNNDTVYVTALAKVGDNEVVSKTVKLPDIPKPDQAKVLKPGEHRATHRITDKGASVTIRGVPNDNTPVIVGYLVTNSGYKDNKAVEDAINKLLTGLTGAGSAANPWFAALGALGGYVSKVGFANCDGTLAAASFDAVANGRLVEKASKQVTKPTSLTGRALAAQVGKRGSYTQTLDEYPGFDSPAGCGENSKYYVTWSVKRE